MTGSVGNFNSKSFLTDMVKSKNTDFSSKVIEDLTKEAAVDNKLSLEEFKEIAKFSGVKDDKLTELLSSKAVTEAFGGKAELDPEATLKALPSLTSALDGILAKIGVEEPKPVVPKPEVKPIETFQRTESESKKLDGDEYQFSNKNEYFQNLVGKAVEMAKAKQEKGKTGFSEEDVKALEEFAKTDKVLTRDERLFIQALKNNDGSFWGKNTFEKILEKDFDPKNFVLDIGTKKEVGKEKTDILKVNSTGDLANPLNSTTVDKEKTVVDEISPASKLGLPKFVDGLFTKSNEELKKIVLDKFTSPEDAELRASMVKLVDKLGDDKEALVFLKIMTERTPPISKDDLKEVSQKLTGMLNTDYDARVGNSRDLVVSAMHDIALPANISQKWTGSCAGTCIQIKLAIESPKEYLNMLDSLSKNQEYTTVSGAKIPPNWTFDDEGKKVKDKDGKVTETLKDTGRSISSKIMQNAIMDFGDGARRAYDSSSNNNDLSYGLRDNEVEVAHDAIFGDVSDVNSPNIRKALDSINPSKEKPVTATIGFNINGNNVYREIQIIGQDANNITFIDEGKEQTWTKDELSRFLVSDNGENEINTMVKKELVKNIVASNPSPSKPVEIAMKFNEEGKEHSSHAVNVIGIDDKNVTIINPWGREETFSREELEKRIQFAVLDKKVP